MTFELDETPEGIDLVVTGDWSDQARNMISGGLADGLVLNYAKGFSARDLRFLQDLPIRRLHVLDRALNDLGPVYSLASTLTALRVQTDPQTPLDLDRLPLVTALSVGWSQIQGSLRYAPQLERLFILSYSEEDLTPLTVAPNLVRVVMKDYPRVRSLNGLEGLPWLAELGIHVAQRLEDISAVERLASPILTTLELASCRQISDLSAVSACSALSFFDASEGGDLPSASFLAGLEQLEGLYLYGSTRVLDGDLRPIAELPRLTDFRMQNRRHYSPSVKEIQEAISRR